MKPFIVMVLWILPSAALYAAPPAILFSDLTSGPNTGGQNGKGSFVTIVGKNFGASRGGSTVSVGGGAADNYPVWSDTRITFQMGNAARTGSITVTTAGGTSNGIPFTVRPGRIFFCSAASRNDPGAGSFDDPWRSPRSYFTTMQPGDICYFRTGTYTGRYGRQTYPFQISFDDSVPSGAAGNEIAWVAYPGETPLFRAQDDYPGCIGLYGFGRQYYVIAGLSLYSIGNGRGAVRLFDNNNTIVNCRIEGVKTLSYGMFEVSATQGTKIWGNECFGATSANKLDHILYCQGGADNVDFGWNYVHDNDIAVGPVISLNQDGGHSAGTVYENIRIHDNLIDCRNSSDALRVLGTVDAALGGSCYFYNNVVIESGSNSSYYNAVYLNSCSVYIYNNTFYRSRGANSSVIAIEEPAATWHPETVEIKNNIFYNQPNCGYIKNADASLAKVTVDANCYFGGAGAPPAKDAHPVTADPQFVDPAAFNFHLRDTSPCIARGVNTAVVAVRDPDGLVRVPGRIDIGAYQYYIPGVSGVVAGGVYAISGYVTDADSAGIRGVTVRLDGAVTATTLTAAGGTYRFANLAGNSSYRVTATKKNWRISPASVEAAITDGDRAGVDFSGTPLATYDVAGAVRDASGAPLEGVAVTLSDGRSRTVTTDAGGAYRFPGIAGGEPYRVAVSREGYVFTPAVRNTGALNGTVTDWYFTGINTAGMQAGEVRVIGSTGGRGTVNPDKGETAKIFFRGTASGRFECRIIALTGELVWEDAKDGVSEGIFDWAPRDIASGIYVVSVKGPGISASKKVSILR
jgi:hypothetical protein